MNLSKEIKNFFNGQPFSEGIKITCGALMPSLLFSYMGDIRMGITVSLGAIMTSIPDSAGPTKDRQNAMLLLVPLIFLISFVTKSINHLPIATGIFLAVLCFAVGMISIYGARAAAFGTACIMVMLLNIDDINMGEQSALAHSLLLTAGGTWYTLLSLSITRFRPFRLPQQALAESMTHIANYLRLKADFYDPGKTSDVTYKKLIQEQVEIQQKQENVMELLYRSKAQVRDTTRIGRLLVVIFTDMLDIFESMMATHYDYKAIRSEFGETPVLMSFCHILKKLANEIDNLAYYITINRRPRRLYSLASEIEQIYDEIEEQEKAGKNAIVLKKILINVRNLAKKVGMVYRYFETKELKMDKNPFEEGNRLVSTRTYQPKLLRDNLTLESGNFRHALRLTIVMLVAYVLSFFLPFGNHSYWILMTILVIMKPGFSLTKQRNFQRMQGTIIGGLMGIIILFAFHDETLRFVFMLAFMVMAYTYLRRNYIVGTIFLTPYILIVFSFMTQASTLLILKERVIDTILGSLMAFSSSYVLFPSWESAQVKQSMQKMLIANYHYLHQIFNTLLMDEVDQAAYRVRRKDLYVNLANVASIFQRMVTEPKSKQRNAKELNRFTIFNHILSSYSVALLNVVKNADKSSFTDEHLKLMRKTLYQLAQTISIFDEAGQKPLLKESELKSNLATLPKQKMGNKQDIDFIKEELSLIYKVTQDMHKICQNMYLEAA